MRLVLASRSPARLSTLRRAGIEPQVLVSQVDEEAVQISDPQDLVLELARLKCEAIAATVPRDEELVVVGCDSVLDLDRKPYGKPGSPAAAVRLWHRLAGRQANLVTGHHVVVRRGGTERRASRVAQTTVYFADLSTEEIEAVGAPGADNGLHDQSSALGTEAASSAGFTDGADNAAGVGPSSPGSTATRITWSGLVCRCCG